MCLDRRPILACMLHMVYNVSRSNGLRRKGKKLMNHRRKWKKVSITLIDIINHVLNLVYINNNYVRYYESELKSKLKKKLILSFFFFLCYTAL